MIIKRVVVQGFKTYAKKTDFVFDPGVTAIVGPNGSGKSNVVDAIRWCLGEQSFSLLRSKKTSDVIFAGSDRKSRLGMAQVSVTLDNSTGELPVDFTEVEITRRAYRDGDNEYLLNGQRVRLQDITEILAPTGLGKRTYALIGQGLIERILSMAPGELRTLFEEAAGITTSQTKRSSALRRLDAAQLNLTRVQDITAEISPRLGYLRRQAERAEERNRIADELRDLLLDWFGYHWHAAQRKAKAAIQAELAIRQRVQSHRQELTALSTRIEQLRVRQSGLRAQVAELHHVSSAHHRQAEQIGRQHAVAQEGLRQLNERIESGRQELSPLRLQQDTLAERIVDSERRIAELQEETVQRTGRVDALQTKINERQAAQQALEAEVETQRDLLLDTRTAVAQTESKFQQLRERSTELASELAKEDEERESSADRVSTLLLKQSTYKDRLHDIETRVGEVQSDIEAVQLSIDDFSVHLDELAQVRQAADREADRLQTRLEVLNRLRDEGAGYADGVRAVLQAANLTQRDSGPAQRLQGIRGTLASVIRVPPSLDRAIETALGGAYQNVITQTWKDAQNTIGFLNSSRGGRATFLPLDRLHNLPPIVAPSLPGVLGNAADLVEFDPEVTDAVFQFLSRVWVVEDLDTARHALDRSGSGPRPTVVTLHGEIVRPGGAVSGGIDSRRRDQSILAREREHRELPDQLSRATSVAEARRAQYAEMNARLENLRGSLSQLRESHESLLQEERLARSDLLAVEREVERWTQARDWHTERMRQIEEELTGAGVQQAAIHEELAGLRNRLASAEATLQQAELAKQTSGIGYLIQKLADLRAAAAEVQGDLQSQTAVLETQRRILHSTENQLAAKEQQIASLSQESASHAAVIEQLGREEDEIRVRLTAVLSEMEPAERTLEALETEQTTLESNEHALQATLRRDESEWNAAQLAAQRAEDALGRLKNDIEQELGLVFFDESDEAANQPPLPWNALVERLPALEALPAGLDDKVTALRGRLGRLRNVNPDAPREYAEAAERCEFLERQGTDLEEAIRNLRDIIARLDTEMESELAGTFYAVAEQFEHYFQVLFNGGAARLTLMDPNSITSSGIEIVARPPGKRPQSLALLSGGERTLAACALIFAILRVSPTPFCVLDEVDAALDEANVDRFRFALDELSQHTQFILITHNRRTLEGTNAIYGVTMGNDGTSRVISLKLEGERIVGTGQSDASSATDVIGVLSASGDDFAET